MNPPMTPPVVLTIAGSDSGGGAGIQADLKVFAALRGYGVSVVTAVTAQNTRGVTDVFPVPGPVVAGQLDAVLEDLPPVAVKVGMLATVEAAEAVAARAEAGDLPNLVLDPVLASSSGRRLGIVAAIERLLPYATVATPNRAEASALLGWQVINTADMTAAARQLADAGPEHVVVTGGDAILADGMPATRPAGHGVAGDGMAGHGIAGAGMAGHGVGGDGMAGRGVAGDGPAGEVAAGDRTPGGRPAGETTAGDGAAGDGAAGDGVATAAVDAVYGGSGARLLIYPRLCTPNTHGTGCTFSSAIAARLACGDAPPDAIDFAKAYVVRALTGAQRWRLGTGHGPLDHFGWNH